MRVGAVGERDPRDVFIQRVVAGKSFCDVGGLWGTTSEKVSVAAGAGASRLAMLDIAREGSELWQAFDERLTDEGISREDVDHITADITSVDPANRFDVVHCSGVIYHVPDPVQTLAAVRRLTAEYLVLASVVAPPEIRNSAGTITFAPGQALFLPHLDDRALTVLKVHLSEGGVRAVGIDIPEHRWSLDDYAPWWWLFTTSALRQMLVVVGFQVIDDAPYWGGKTHVFLARCP